MVVLTLGQQYNVWEKPTLISAAGEGLTNIIENHTFVHRARYLRLLRHIRR